MPWFEEIDARRRRLYMPHPLQSRLVAEVIDREGGYIDHPADRGGPTKYGITQAVARDAGYTGHMKDLPWATAFAIYTDRYWDSLRLNAIAEIDERLAEYLFDYGVNSGPGRAGAELQRLLNVLNRQERDYPDVAVDGAVGPKTLNALDGYHDTRGRGGLSVMADALNGLRIHFLVDIAERRESQEAFSFGWLRRVIELRGEGVSRYG